MEKWKGKQTYSQLSQEYSCSIRMIQRYLDKIQVNHYEKQRRKVIVLMDTTYWRRGSLGVMLFKDAIKERTC
ncbi:MAG: hypothetical protein R2771_10080 [Saprospiraceae bacterium]